jgi:inorganic pyrophosphatase
LKPRNYGFIEGSKGEDGMPLDVIILGDKLKAGLKIDEKIIGRVKFFDDGKKDYKYIAAQDQKRHEMSIRFFFKIYVLAKTLINLLRHRRLTANKFDGIEWYKAHLKDVSEIPA